MMTVDTKLDVDHILRLAMPIGVALLAAEQLLTAGHGDHPTVLP